MDLNDPKIENLQIQSTVSACVSLCVIAKIKAIHHTHLRSTQLRTRENVVGTKSAAF